MLCNAHHERFETDVSACNLPSFTRLTTIQLQVHSAQFGEESRHLHALPSPTIGHCVRLGNPPAVHQAAERECGSHIRQLDGAHSHPLCGARAREAGEVLAAAL